MNAPPAVCPFCGWHGPAPGFRIENSTDITFEGRSITCPNCGREAKIIDGTYDFIGGVVRLVRDANLTLPEVNELRRAAAQARRTGQAPEEFITAHPAAAPIVNLIVQQGQGRDPLMILLMVLAIVVGALQMVQNAKYHAEDQRPQGRRGPAPTTQALSDRQLNKIARDVETKLHTERLLAKPQPQASRAAKPPRKKRPPKQYGKKKPHGRRSR